MADGGSNPLKGAVQDFSEAVVKPVGDEVGKAIEVGVQSVTAKPVKSPQDQARQQQEEAKKRQFDALKKQNILKFIQQYNTDYQKLQQQKIQEQQKKQTETQETQEKKQVKQFEVQKKQESIAVQNAKTRTETRKGVGG